MTDPMEATRYFVSTGVIGLTVLMLPMSVGAGQGSASFQVSLRIVARPPAPKVSQKVISAASPGDPPHPMFKDRVMTHETSEVQFTIVTTEF
ncbi:hypothetical protein [Polaromonas sp. C04]|uniref:hypothetical protein n=1 Tax=Polaromonas sp. C04 TaxID=1945857 RepID=UPI001184730C|nr:hypothetical protein [Polaromonas sp. C04]